MSAQTYDTGVREFARICGGHVCLAQFETVYVGFAIGSLDKHSLAVGVFLPELRR